MENITIFIDNVGRMIIGTVNEPKSNKSILAVEKPAIVNVQADQQTGQISVQLLPYVFSEFVKNQDSVAIWNFNRGNITTSSNLELDERITQQYTQIMNNVATSSSPDGQPMTHEEPEVIKLFDE